MDMTIIAVSTSLLSLILAITAMIFSFLSQNSIKSLFLKEFVSVNWKTDNLKGVTDALRLDVDAFNRDTYKKLAEKYNSLELSIQSISNKVDASETARKNWGNKWAPFLGKLKKDVELPEVGADGGEELPDTIPIPDNVIYPENFKQSEREIPVLPKKGFASLM